jgi:hypothetical protein
LVKFSRPLLAVPDSEKLNWLSMPIDQQNLTNNRRALSRENMACGHKAYALRISYVGGPLGPKLFCSRLKPTPTKDNVSIKNHIVGFKNYRFPFT